MKKVLQVLSAFALAAVSIVGCDKMESKNTSIVIVGMNNSAKFGKCLGSDVDATTMTRILSKYGDPKVFRDGEAKKAKIVDALKEAVKSELCIFYYSGHGGSERFSGTNASKGEEPTGKDQYLCLYDTYLLDDEIWNIVSKASGRVMLIFDCCHSETMFRSVSGLDIDVESEPFTMQMLDEIVLPQDSELKMLVWSGCPDSDYSYGDSKGGVLTVGIQNAFLESRKYSEVWKRAAEHAASQHPKKTVIGDWPDIRVFR